MLNNTSYLSLSWLHQKRKLNVVATKIVAKKRKPINLMPTKPKALLSNKSKEHITLFKITSYKASYSIIRFGNWHNHEMLISQKLVLLLSWSGSSSINWHSYHCTLFSPQLLVICSEIKQALNSSMFKLIACYHIKILLAT